MVSVAGVVGKVAINNSSAAVILSFPLLKRSRTDRQSDVCTRVNMQVFHLRYR